MFDLFKSGNSLDVANAKIIELQEKCDLEVGSNELMQQEVARLRKIIVDAGLDPDSQ